MVEARAPALEAADRLLMMPDLFHHWLCGAKVGEYSIATTSQCYDVARGAWATSLLERAGVPVGIFPPVVSPGTPLGPVLPAVADRIGARGVQVIAPAAHDTESAVAAVPARAGRHAYVSSGTWSLLGAVTRSPVVNETARSLGFTNEGGVDGTVQLQRNHTGLWLVQECRRAWARGTGGEPLGYDALEAMARAGRPFQAAIDPDHPSFDTPEDMPRAVQEFCARTGQEVPARREDVMRVVLESLAWMYRRTLRDLERLLGETVEVLHVVGGGSRNELLCQLAADACNRPVLAGPVEATATGNVLAQAIAGGVLGSWDQAREVVRNTFPPRAYEPARTGAWDEVSRRIDPILERARTSC
jgi:rhamnulokinase